MARARTRSKWTGQELELVEEANEPLFYYTEFEGRDLLRPSRFLLLNSLVS